MTRSTVLSAAGVALIVMSMSAVASARDYVVWRKTDGATKNSAPSVGHTGQVRNKVNVIRSATFPDLRGAPRSTMRGIRVR
jgi:hypothetical protein